MQRKRCLTMMHMDPETCPVSVGHVSSNQSVAVFTATRTQSSWQRQCQILTQNSTDHSSRTLQNLHVHRCSQVAQLQHTHLRHGIRQDTC